MRSALPLCSAKNREPSIFHLSSCVISPLLKILHQELLQVLLLSLLFYQPFIIFLHNTIELINTIFPVYSITQLFSNMRWKFIPYHGFPHIAGQLIANHITKVFCRYHNLFILNISGCKDTEKCTRFQTLPEKFTKHYVQTSCNKTLPQ